MKKAVRITLTPEQKKLLNGLNLCMAEVWLTGVTGPRGTGDLYDEIQLNVREK